jgi:hypothetical protein
MTIDPIIAKNAATLQQLIDDVAQQGKGMMERLQAQARQALAHTAEKTRDMRERDLLDQATRLLQKHSEQMAARYPQALREGFSAALLDEPERTGETAPLKFDQLELMDERQVQERVEAARGLQMAVMAVESELGDFNALICALLGLKQVQADRNPIRPEVFVQALRTILAESGVEVNVSNRWGNVMGPALGQELRKLYIQLKERLGAQGIEPVGYAVLRTPQASGGARGGAARPAGDGNAAVAATQGAEQVPGSDVAVLTIHQLRRLLAGELEGATAELAARMGARVDAASANVATAPHADLDSSLTAAVEVLGEVRHMVQTLDRMGRGSAQAQDLSSVRAKLRGDAKAEGQVLGQEVVNLIIANIASDSRLLPPVQQVVSSMEPSLLRLALIDPRFFSDKQHPARLLLEEVAQHSFVFESEQAAGFQAFLDRVRQAVKELDQSAIADAQPFAKVLSNLRLTWAQEEQQQHQRQEAAKQALMRAEQRNVLAAAFAKAIVDRPDAVLIPDEVMAFVLGPWAQVTAHARLVQPAPGEPVVDYAALVEDLFWSVRPDLARKNLPGLVKLIPVLLGSLRQGLRQIEYPQEATNEFFDELIALHEKCLDSTGAGVSRTRRPAAPTPLSRPGGLAGTDPTSPWLAPEEARDSGFMDDLGGPGDMEVTTDFAATEPMSMPMGLTVETAHETPELVAQLQVGTWVEMLTSDQWVQAQLTWASPQGTLFLFTGLHGSTHSMTRRLLDRLCRDNHLRLSAPASVVDQALDAVTKVAMRNSVFMDIQDESGAPTKAKSDD